MYVVNMCLFLFPNWFVQSIDFLHNLTSILYVFTKQSYFDCLKYIGLMQACNLKYKNLYDCVPQKIVSFYYVL